MARQFDPTHFLYDLNMHFVLEEAVKLVKQIF